MCFHAAFAYRATLPPLIASSRVAMRDFLSGTIVSRFIRVSLLSGCLALALPSRAHADAEPLSGFGFLQLESSARAAALGGSLSALYADDVNVLFHNPALLNADMNGVASLSYLNYLYDVNAGFLAYAQEFQGIGTVAAGIRFLTWGEMTERDETGEELGTFGATDVALTVGLSRDAGEGLRYGGNVHLVRSNIASFNAVALAADAGVAYHVPDQGLTVSASINNVGRALDSFGSVDDDLPLDLRLAVSKRLAHVPLLLSLTAYNLHQPTDAPDDVGTVNRAFQFLKLGAEFRF
ncbi:MAG TPA: PorV/PorQ family protein, partial [Rhodothermales bacterium]